MLIFGLSVKDGVILKLSLKKTLVFLTFGFNIFVVAILASLRDFSVGSDTSRYVGYFLSATESDHTRHEPGFNAFVNAVASFSEEPRVFLFFVVIIVTTLLAAAFYKYFRFLFNTTPGPGDILIFLSLTLFSSWYFVAFANGIRQGISISALYLALYFLSVERKLFVSLTFFIFSASFHLSSFLLLPFVLFVFFPFRFVFFFWLVFGFFYPLGINEFLVKFVSEFFGLGLYESIRFYSITVSEAGAGRYEGFSISFFGYTILWPLVFFFLASSTRLLSELEKSRWFVIVKVYMILCFPYFVFGFGPFSNRYAFICF